MEENKKDLAEEQVVEEAEVTAPETSEEQVADETQEVVETVTEEQFNEDNGKKKKKPVDPKKKKKRIIIWSVVAGVLVAILLAIGITVAVMFRKAPPVKQDAAEAIKIQSVRDANGGIPYYVGSRDTLNLTVALPELKDFTLDKPSDFKGEEVEKPEDNKETAKAGEVVPAVIAIENNVLTVTTPGDPVLLYATLVTPIKDKDGNVTQTHEVLSIHVVDAFNLDDVDSAEKDLRLSVDKPRNDKNKGSVVLHTDIVTKHATRGFVVAGGNTIYGNNHEIHTDSFSAPRDDKKSSKTSWGTHAFTMYENSGLQDLHIFVNTVKAGDDFFLEDFEFSGNGIDIDSKKMTGEYGQITIKHCIVENGQKLLHVAGGNVLVDGCMFRNAADACIAAGTYGKDGDYGERMGNKITIRNSVAANSTVAGFLFYGFDGVVPKGDKIHQQTLNIEGFFDIYNWKSIDSASLVPGTEIYAPLVNNNVKSEIKNDDFAPFIIKGADGKQYVHFGIIRLSTGKVAEQNPTITYNGEGGKRGQLKDALSTMQLTEKSFPLPGWATKIGIIQGVDMISFSEKVTPYIAPADKLEGQRLAQVLYEMQVGRESMPVPAAK